ncbi:MAG: RNA-binding domain-containing protein [Thermoproteota archaeon]|nr:RNA-binding domain-containing protein [Thermoproteota archaeon]
MNKTRVRVETTVHPTEHPEKVKRAVENVFGAMNFEEKPLKQGSLLVAETVNGLTKIYNQLRRQRIRGAARTLLLRGLRGKTITFYLNKQAAYVGRASFSSAAGESPLGPIKVQIRCENPQEVINWLAPKTV